MKNLIKPKIKTNWLYIAIIILIASFIIGGILIYQYQWWPLKEIEENRLTRSSCLTSDEIADYPIDERYDERAKIPKTPIIIYVRDKVTKNEKFRFQINDVHDRAYSLELHTCGAYVIRMFNYDPKKSIQNPGFRAELWRYQYNGTAKSLLLLVEKDEGGIYKSYYSYHFNIDPNERYLILEKSYLGKDDYALVVKDLETLEDLFVLRLKDILEEHLDIVPGSFGFGIWLENGEYLCGDIFSGALDTAYGCIKISTWETEIFPSPPDLLAGVERSLNYKKWYLAYVDIPTFTGVQEVYEQIIEQARKEGRQKNLFIYNLRTKEKTKIASADPEWEYNINWLSDTELEYELPSGEKKIYKIEGK